LQHSAVVILRSGQMLAAGIVGELRGAADGVGDGCDAALAVVGEVEALAGGVREAGQLEAAVIASDAISVWVLDEFQFAVGAELLHEAALFRQLEANWLRNKPSVITKAG